MTEPSREPKPQSRASASPPEASPSSSPPPLTAEALAALAQRLRRYVIRMTAQAASGHPGGSLSATDIIATLYFGGVLRHRPKEPRWEGRDRFILSKGHAAPALYAALAEAGYFPHSELATLRQLGSILQGHPDMTLTPGVEMSAGSLGQGLSFGIGMALAGRLDARPYRVYVLLGDGECDEGQVWEAAMAAAHFRLDHLTAMVDRNQQQIDGWTKDVMNLEPLADKWRAFGWEVIEADGHDLAQLQAAFSQAHSVVGKPTVIIAHTIKGKGVSFMEHNLKFHGTAPKGDEVAQALSELGADPNERWP